MNTKIGRLLGKGRTAEVFEYGDGRAIKLLLPGFSERALRDEAMKTAAASAAGSPAPPVYGIEEVDGRPGLVMDKADGRVMVDLIVAAPWRARHWGRTLAAVHEAVVRGETDQLPDVREVLASKISRAESLRAREAEAAKNALLELGGGKNVLHGDFHPLNIYLDHEPAVIDWVDSSRGPVAADLARSFWLTSTHVIPRDFPRRWAIIPVAGLVGRTYRTEILRLTRLTPEDVEPWVLPVLAGRLSEGIEHETEHLVREVRRRV